MVKPFPLRSVLVVLIGAAVYYALLGLVYARAPYSTIPHWWRHFMPDARVALVTWFTLLNASGAILAAIPVAFGVVLGTTTRRAALALIIGVVPALYIVVEELMLFGLPPSVATWIVEIAQFFAVGLAVVAIVAPLRGSPLTVGSSDRGASLR